MSDSLERTGPEDVEDVEREKSQDIKSHSLPIQEEVSCNLVLEITIKLNLLMILGPTTTNFINRTEPNC